MKKKQCAIEQEYKKEALAELSALAATGLIEVYYGDESGFWQNPVVSRGWQCAGRRNSPAAGKRQALISFRTIEPKMRRQVLGE